MFYHRKGLCCIFIVLVTNNDNRWSVKKKLKIIFLHARFLRLLLLHRQYLVELTFQAMPTLAVSAKLKELLSQATPPISTLQYGFMLMTLDILEFRSKFYMIFNVCSDSENHSYVTIIVSLHIWMQLLTA